MVYKIFKGLIQVEKPHLNMESAQIKAAFCIAFVISVNTYWPVQLYFINIALHTK